MLRPTSRDKFNDLNRPRPDSIEPIPRAVGTYDMARMIAKKTKFRVLDVKEVLDEVGPCIYSILLSRQSIRFDGINIRSSWNRLRFPKFVRLEDSNDDRGYWTFGYFLPKIDMEKQWQMMYSGAKGAFPDSFIKKISPYLPDGIDTADDIYEYCMSIMRETAQMGKRTVVDDDGWTIPIPPRRKRFKWNPDFHPTFLQWRRYFSLRRQLLSEYHAMKHTKTPLPFSHVRDGLRKANIFGHNYEDTMVIPQEEEETESDQV